MYHTESSKTRSSTFLTVESVDAVFFNFKTSILSMPNDTSTKTHFITTKMWVIMFSFVRQLSRGFVSFWQVWKYCTFENCFSFNHCPFLQSCVYLF